MVNLTGWHDTIIAPVTAPGTSAIAVIRLSGSKSIEIVSQLCKEKKLEKKHSHTAHFCVLRWEGEVLDEVVVTIFRNPKSFTGEDIVEIGCHGSPYIVKRIIEVCVLLGARPARAGEFTQKAFLNGKMDLAQAEAVADVINAETRAAQRAAMNQMRGGFSIKLSELRERLINFAALIELELDFSDEDVEFADRGALNTLVQELRNETEKLIASFRLGNVVKNGVRVAIIGKPNAGKSTLLNALLNEERAIVSDIPGTTRDTIEEVLNINGILFRLIDTAGIREHSTDLIENLGIERSRVNAEKADIILYLKDMTDATDNEMPWLDAYKSKVIPVGTKFDKWKATNPEQHLNASNNPVSAKDGYGVEQLKELMFEMVVSDQQQIEGNIVTNARHYEALKQMELSLKNIADGLNSNISGDLLAPDIRNCLYHLGTITGQVEIDRDILGTIFGKFCIGK